MSKFIEKLDNLFGYRDTNNDLEIDPSYAETFQYFGDLLRKNAKVIIITSIIFSLILTLLR